MAQDEANYTASGKDREILNILLESDLYLELPLKERHDLFKHIVKTYLYSDPANMGNC